MNTGAVTSSNTSSTPSSSTTTNNRLTLKPMDFIKLMVTQLQNQDPTQPAGSDQLLSQMSQIGQLQSSTSLQSSLTAMVAQNQIGAAGNLIGKSIQGVDDKGAAVNGVVDSVLVQSGNVYLQLNSGNQVQMGNVTKITTPPAPAPVTTAIPNSNQAANAVNPAAVAGSISSLNATVRAA